MTISLEELIERKKHVQQSRREADQARGALRELRARLQQEFGCSTKEGLQAQIWKLDKELRAMKRREEILTRRLNRAWRSRNGNS